MESLKIIQISDPHIGWDDENPYGVDVRKNLENIVNAVSNENTNLIVLTGDMCFRDPNEKTYKWIKSLLDPLSIEYYILPGNHDDAGMIFKIFGYEQELKKNELYFLKNFKGFPIFFLDSSKGFVSDEQLKWLKHQIIQLNQSVYIFMHHPPALANVPHMDNNWALENIEDVQKILFETNKNIHVFCGHYHVDKTLQIKNLNIYIAPSIFFNLSQDTEEFQVENTLVGYRKIELTKTGVFSSVKYLV